ncbi:MAG: hypothetical protein M3R58_01310 [Pseudomonadota bacterium]|nr:hypothetical protein [Pseudomonadota bacterium]
MSLKIAALAAVLATAGAAQAQHQHYAGQDSREIRALSADEVKQYLSGAGAGFAKAAELNHYPGPMHALELADQIGLTAEQRAATRQLMDAHKAEARAIGVSVVDAERALQALFLRGSLTEGELGAAVLKAATLQGEYRLSHLETHRRLRAVLSDPQVARYDELRGYASGSLGAGHRH